MFKCQECNRKFRTTKSAEKASNSGCPRCGGVDIDLDTDIKVDKTPRYDSKGFHRPAAPPKHVNGCIQSS